MARPVQPDHAAMQQQLQDPHYIAAIRTQMLKFTLLQLSSLSQAEDMVQEALTCAYEHVNSFSGRACFKTWVFAILKNKIKDAIRQKKKLVSVSELFQEEADECSIETLFNASGHWQKLEAPLAWQSPEQMMVHEEFWIIFQACLEHLPARHAQVFMLREMIELSSAEICTKLELSLSNFNVVMYRCRTRLRECLENKWLLNEDCSC